MHNKNPEERTDYPLKYADARVKAENKERVLGYMCWYRGKQGKCKLKLAASLANRGEGLR